MNQDEFASVQGQIAALHLVLMSTLTALSPLAAATSAVELVIALESAKQEDLAEGRFPAQTVARNEIVQGYLGLLSARSRC